MRMANAERPDVIAALGTAFNFKTWDYPDPLYASLDRVAEVFYRNQHVMSKTAIIVCGKAAFKDIEQNRIAPTTEAAAMSKYLIEAHNIPAERIAQEDESVHTPGNLMNLGKMIPGQANNIYIPVAEGRRPRIEYLAHMILNEYSVVVDGVATPGFEFPLEPKLLGDAMCTLGTDPKAMPPLEASDGTSTWLDLAAQHAKQCDRYVPSAKALPFINYHLREDLQV